MRGLRQLAWRFFGVALLLPGCLPAGTAERVGRDGTLDSQPPDPANEPPAIELFTATPAKGVAPLEVRLDWRATDPEGKPLDCELDANGDGQPERADFDCAHPGPFAFRFTGAGTYEALLRATDAKGLTVERRVTVTLREPVGDVSVKSVLWGQTLYGESLRLVAGKPALLRVNVVADAPKVGPLVVRVRGEDAQGAALGTVDLKGPDVVPTAEPAVEQLSGAFTVTLVKEWVAPGLKLTVQLDPDDEVPETNEGNNTHALTPTVGAATKLYITHVPVNVAGVTPTPPTDKAIAELIRHWPVASAENKTRAAYTFSKTLNGSTGWGTLLDEMQALQKADGSKQYYYGWVQIGSGSGVYGIGFLSTNVAAGRTNSLDTFVHELGHNFGRPHAPCGGAAGPDPNFPYAGGGIGKWGYDLTGKALVNPSARKDLMSYCDPVWVSDYNYDKVQTFLESRPPKAFRAEASAERSLLVVGMLRPDGSVEMRPVHRLALAPQDEEPGPYSLTLRFVGSTRTVPLQVAEAAEGGTLHFAVVVPDAGAPLLSLELGHAGHRLALRELSTDLAPSPPRLRRVDRGLLVEWDARAHPFASVTHRGEERTTLALYLEGGQRFLAAPTLPDGGDFEVSLSDGLNGRLFELTAP